MRAATFFSGIDAPEVSAPQFDWRWRAEIDPFANAVSEHHRPGVPNLGDMEKADFDHAEPVELVVFGSPCQSFSVAGKRLGLDDPRGNLALVALAAIGRIRPRWFVFENVPGLLSSDGGRDFGAFLGAVGQLGYGWAYRTLDAQYFGVPQRRRRLFVVGCAGDWRRAAAVLFERESLRWNPTPCREERQGAAPTLSARTRGGGGLGTDFDCDGGLIADNVSLPLKTASNKWDATHETYVTHALRAEGFDASEDGTGRGTPLVAQAFNWQSGGDCRGLDPQDVTMALQREQVPAIAFSAKDCGADAGETAPTLRAGGHVNSHANAGVMPAIAIQERAVSENPANGPGGKGWQQGLGFTLEARNKAQAVSAGMTVRRLTPRECERLQGFPDDYTKVPHRGRLAENCPDGPRYKALGNSMAVPCIGWILARLASVHGLLEAA